MSDEQQPMRDDAAQTTQDNKPHNAERPMPPPPQGVDDPDQIEAAQERWTACPLKDCKRDPDLLYQDFFLRDIRTNRVMCTACAVRTEVGYLAREVVKQSDDRFFEGTNQDYVVVFGVMAGASLGANLLSTIIPIGGIFLWFILAAVGSGLGMYASRYARKWTGGRVGRQSGEVAVAGLVVGLLLMPFVWGILNFGTMALSFILTPEVYTAIIGLDGLILTGAMALASYGVFKRRI